MATPHPFSTPKTPVTLRQAVIVHFNQIVLIHYSDDMDFGEDFGASQYSSANEKDMILSFFNESSLEELQILPGCKKSKAALIVQMRPFSDWDDLIAKIEVSIGKNVITEGKSVIKTRR